MDISGQNYTQFQIFSWLKIMLASTFVIIFFIGLLGYLRTEIATNLYQKEFNVVEICGTDETGFKDFKIVEYQKFRKRAKVYCLFSDPEKSLLINLSLRENWEITTSEKLNAWGKFYWPIYR